MTNAKRIREITLELNQLAVQRSIEDDRRRVIERSRREHEKALMAELVALTVEESAK